MLIGSEYKLSREDIFRSFAAVIDYLHFFDKNMTVNGFTVILDFEQYSIKHDTHIPQQDKKEAAQAWQV